MDVASADPFSLIILGKVVGDISYIPHEHTVYNIFVCTGRHTVRSLPSSMTSHVPVDYGSKRVHIVNLALPLSSPTGMLL
jgi:hypothetical protein